MIRSACDAVASANTASSEGSRLAGAGTAAGCPVIQMEEPQIHMVPARGKPFGRIEIPELVKIFRRPSLDLVGVRCRWNRLYPIIPRDAGCNSHAALGP